jgi:hypothetical protein
MFKGETNQIKKNIEIKVVIGKEVQELILKTDKTSKISFQDLKEV